MNQITAHSTSSENLKSENLKSGTKYEKTTYLYTAIMCINTNTNNKYTSQIESEAGYNM